MDITSLQRDTGFDTEGIYDLFTSTFFYNTSVALREYKVVLEDEMRVDLLFKNIYGIESSVLHLYLHDVDIILYINNIDNPLSIKEGMLLRYPPIGDMDKFRYTPTDSTSSINITKQLGVQNSPDKVSKVDVSRQQYIENDYSLPPVVLSTPREPVRLINGRFSIGGL
jgi:hypothetical protein